MKKKKIKKKKMTLEELEEMGGRLFDIQTWLLDEGVVGDGFYKLNSDIYNIIKDCKNKSAYRKYISADSNLSLALRRYEKETLNIINIVGTEYADMEDELMEEDDD